MAVSKLTAKERQDSLARLSSFIPEATRSLLMDLGSDPLLTLKEKIQATFVELSDPLLSASDFQVLFDLSSEKEALEILNSLVDENFLESDSKTLRPLMPKANENLNFEKLFRLKGIELSVLKLLALETELRRKANPDLIDYYYQFSCDARLIRQIAAIEYFDAIVGTGVQREEVKKHIEAIRKGIEFGNQIPNSVLLVFDPSRTIHSASGELEEGDRPGTDKGFINRPTDSTVEIANPQDETSPISQRISSVQIFIPYRKAAFDHEKILSIADGQQRTAALGLASIDKVPEYTFTINAILPADSAAKRMIFSIANSARKLNSDFQKLIQIGTPLDSPTPMVARRLALDEHSPLYQLIELPGVKSAKAVVKFNSVEQALSKGFMQEFEGTGYSLEADELFEVSKKFYSAVKETWPEAWGLKPIESKLMSGLGFRSLTLLFAEDIKRHRVDEKKSLDSADMWKEIKKGLTKMKKYCVAWRQEDAIKMSNLHQVFFATQIKPKSLTFQDITHLTRALRLARSEQWHATPL